MAYRRVTIINTNILRLLLRKSNNLSWVQSSNQEKFLLIKNLDLRHKWFHRTCESDSCLLHSILWSQALNVCNVPVWSSDINGYNHTYLNGWFAVFCVSCYISDGCCVLHGALCCYCYVPHCSTMYELLDNINSL